MAYDPFGEGISFEQCRIPVETIKPRKLSELSHGDRGYIDFNDFFVDSRGGLNILSHAIVYNFTEALIRFEENCVDFVRVVCLKDGSNTGFIVDQSAMNIESKIKPNVLQNSESSLSVIVYVEDEITSAMLVSRLNQQFGLDIPDCELKEYISQTISEET